MNKSTMASVLMAVLVVGLGLFLFNITRGASDDGLLSNVTDGVENVTSNVTDTASNVSDKVTDTVDGAVEKVEGAGDAVGEAVDKVEDAGGDVAEAVGEVTEKVEDVKDAVVDAATSGPANETSETNDAPMVYKYTAQLPTVATTLKGYDYTNATGVANYNDTGSLQLSAEFQNLPELAEGWFYEGWLVNSVTSYFISTGALEFEGGTDYTNVFSSPNAGDFNRYVLTLEPDDGDDAPAEHVVEGDFVAN